VTHNQEEALTVADRIAIISDGDLVEEGTARDIYETPQKRFTAEFIGDNNVLEGAVVSVSDGRVTVDLGFARVDVPSHGVAAAKGDAVALSIRSELLRIVEPGRDPDPSWQLMPAAYVEAIYLGLTISHLVRLPDGTEIVARVMSGERSGEDFEPGREVTVGWPGDRARLHVA
ncbi:MAG: TOBE domain-containing protein, partial [Defluviicoccus sp.]|nr:TOBE domain-containing protein [Defluviicoccus sp.]